MNNPEEMPEKNPSNQESPAPWPITYDERGNILGLPPGVSERDVIVFIGNDGKKYAQISSPDLIEERAMWRSDEG